MVSFSFRCPSCSFRQDDVLPRCPQCGEGVEIEVPVLGRGVAALSAAGRRESRAVSLMERYHAVLPIPPRADLTLGEGSVPILRSARIESQLSCEAVFLDLEGANPTGSFKDRGTVVATTYAVGAGARAVGGVSTGNMAVSIAAYAARAGLPALILVAGGVPAEKLRAVQAYGPLVVRVERAHEDLYFDSLKLGRELGIYFMNGDDPLRLEGQKTAAFDIYRGCRPMEPTCILVPVSSGGNIRAILKGLRELQAGGRISAVPRLIGVQPAACAPIWASYEAGLSRVAPTTATETVARSITNPYPPSGDAVLREARAGNLELIAVNDEEMLAAQAVLAEEGIWTQPDSAATVAALARLRRSGSIGPEDHVVCVLTGAGHRDLASVPGAPQLPETVPLDGLRSRLDALLSRFTEALPSRVL